MTTQTRITYTITANLPEGDYQVLATYTTGDNADDFGLLDANNIDSYTDTLVATFEQFYVDVNVDKLTEVRTQEKVLKGKKAKKA